MNLSSRSDWRLVWLLWASGVFAAFLVGKVPPALSDIRHDLGLDLVSAGWVISAFNLMSFLAGSAIGAAADQLGHRRVLISGLLLGALGSVGGALAQDGATLLATRVLQGTGFIMVAVAVPPLMVRVVGSLRDQRLAFGLWATYFPAGLAAMLLLSPALLALVGWRGLWIFNALLVLGMAALVAFGTRSLPAVRRGSFRQGLSGWVRTATARGPLLLGLCFGFYATQFMAVMGFLPLWLVEQRGFAPPLAAALAALAVAANIIGNLGAGRLLALGAPRWALIVGTAAVMATAGFGVYQDALPDSLRFLCVLCFSATGGLIPAALFAATPRLSPSTDLVAATNGLLVQGSNSGQLFGPPLLAMVVQGFGGWHAAPIVLLSAAALTALCGLMIGLHERRLDRAEAASRLSPGR